MDEELFGSDVDAEGSEDGDYDLATGDAATVGPDSAGYHERSGSEALANSQFENGEIESAVHTEDCSGYEINPFASLVHPASVNCLATTRNMRWVFTGGDDGFIRKFDFAGTTHGEQMLTQTQRHGLVDSIEKAGILVSAWENEEYPLGYAPISVPTVDPDTPSSLAAEWSPVYSLDVHSAAVWGLSGCKSGNINFWSIRHDEGQCQHVLRGHSNAVSVLRITPDERGVVSGSWDRKLLKWDLDTGSVVRNFQGLTSQITSCSFKPSQSDGYIPEESPLMASSYDGAIFLFDSRSAAGVGRKIPASLSGAPPWAISATWSANGKSIFCGRRNASVDEFDVAEGKLLRTIRLPRDSGPVSFVHAMPNNRHLLCASQDIIRLWDLDLTFEANPQRDAPIPAQASREGSKSGGPSNSTTPTESRLGTPKLPTAGLTLFLDDDMGGDSVLGTSLGNGIDSDVAATGDLPPSPSVPDLGKTSSTTRPTASMADEDFETAPVVPFTIIPGHNNGVVSNITLDPTKKYMLSASGTRGWDGLASTQCLVYTVKPLQRTAVTVSVED
ncbi:WD40-repeat-containing domain protein [Phlyctochytrium arcticum]|nr:WD40-repeat-containing domain protein [Phlyctochytrium arcticum]